MTDVKRLKRIQNISLLWALFFSFVGILEWRIHVEAARQKETQEYLVREAIGSPGVTPEDKMISSRIYPSRFVVDFTDTKDAFVIMTLISPSEQFTQTTVFHDNLEIKCVDTKKYLYCSSATRICTCQEKTP